MTPHHEPTPLIGGLSLPNGLTAPLVLLAVIVGVDAASGTTTTFNGTYGVAAVLAAVLATVRQTVWVSAVTVLASVASILWNGNVLSLDWFVRVLLCLAMALLAVVSARLRVQREEALQHMTVIAQTVQRALLRVVSGDMGPVSLTARYVSATRGALVGGDLYDAIATPHGIRVMVGDVRGKGMDAVQLAGTVLGGFRRGAYDTASLGELARTLDGLVAAVAGDEDFVTAVLAEFHPDGSAVVVNCGHHPPLLVCPDGTTQWVHTDEPVPPLGLGSDPVPTRFAVPPASRMLLYTDGLIECRDPRGIFFSLEENVARLRGDSLDEALDRLLGRLQLHCGGEIRDDVALVLLERNPVLVPAA